MKSVLEEAKKNILDFAKQEANMLQDYQTKITDLVKQKNSYGKEITFLKNLLNGNISKPEKVDI